MLGEDVKIVMLMKLKILVAKFFYSNNQSKLLIVRPLLKIAINFFILITFNAVIKVSYALKKAKYWPMLPNKFLHFWYLLTFLKI